MRDWLEAHVPESVLAALLSLVGWWVQRKIARSERLEERVAALERDKVTKADIRDLRESMEDTVTRSSARVESRTDEILLHLARRDG